MKRSGEKAAAIVQDLLALARRSIVIEEVLQINDIVKDYLNSPEYAKMKSYHTDVSVEVKLDDELLNMKGSSVHLSKTIMNLVSNAAEAMPRGGAIAIATENRYEDRGIEGYETIPQGEYVLLSVADKGIGIPPMDMRKIFEPFYTKKTMGRSGTGLGMAVVWGTVKDHKGYIDIQSHEGEGTIFKLYFPAVRQELTKAESRVMIESYMGKGESVLVVDDVEEQREIASSILTKLGYLVSKASSGEEAVAFLSKTRADLVILDMVMEPGIDGLETYRRIVEFRPGQKAVITSGFSETSRIREAQKLGAGQYIKKPYTLEKIGLAVRKSLDG
jgi:CheY-like chemotaxis protein